MTSLRNSIFLGCSCTALALPAFAAENVMLTEVPDYSWYAGCFGTSGGNLMGYWDRHGFPSFYTGPTADGVAPLDSRGSNVGIRSLWASKAGFDGRPADQPGHIDDYWEFYLDSVSYSYESTAPDPYITEGRREHAPDCLGDFMGASQNKWTDLDGECTGNIDAFGFTYWDKQGDRRLNFVPPRQGTNEVRDVPSGIKTWTQFKGYDAEVFSQLVDFNPTIPVGKGFTFQDLKTEIDAGYPVILFLQNPDELNRPLPGMPRANPRVHAMLAYGYVIDDNGDAFVRYMTSWGSGDSVFTKWEPVVWQTLLTLRGVIGYRPLPKIVQTEPVEEGMKVTWHGPASHLFDFLAGTTTPVHWYVVEKADSLTNPVFTQVTEPTSSNESIIEDFTAENAFYRVRLLSPEESSPLRQ